MGGDFVYYGLSGRNEAQHETAVLTGILNDFLQINRLLELPSSDHVGREMF
jgi:hypothetical protein